MKDTNRKDVNIKLSKTYTQECHEPKTLRRKDIFCMILLSGLVLQTEMTMRREYASYFYIK